MQFTSPSSKIIALAVTFLAIILSVAGVIFSSQVNYEILPDQTPAPVVSEQDYCGNWARNNNIVTPMCEGKWKLNQASECEWECFTE